MTGEEKGGARMVSFRVADPLAGMVIGRAPGSGWKLAGVTATSEIEQDAVVFLFTRCTDSLKAAED